MRRRRITLLLLLLTVNLGSSEGAQAGVWVESGAALISTQDDGASIIQEAQWLVGSTVGYRFSQGVVLGINGLQSRRSGTHTLFGWGVQGGLFLKGWELTASYLPWVSETEGFTDRSGAGFAVNAGYHWEIAKWLHLGAVATYWVSNLDEENGSPLGVKIRRTALAPRFSIGFHF